MRPIPPTITAWVLLSIMWLIVTPPEASAERLPKSDLNSTLQDHCDFCWYPSPPEEYSNRLPTYQQHRPRRPPGSRPQRYPKGRYKLEPANKHTRPTTLHTRWSHPLTLSSTLHVRVVDGDTIRVGGERIRLRGIDTPELSELEGPAAKHRFEQLLRSGGLIHIVPRGRDVYHRLLADIFVNGQNVAEILRIEGFSKVG